jgi:hypothetical protein
MQGPSLHTAAKHWSQQNMTSTPLRPVSHLLPINDDMVNTTNSSESNHIKLQTIIAKHGLCHVVRHLHLQQPTSTERCEALGCDARCTLDVNTTKHTLLHAPTASCSQTSLFFSRAHTCSVSNTRTCQLMLRTPPPPHHEKITQLMHGEERVCATPVTSHTHTHTCTPQVADSTQVRWWLAKQSYTQEACTSPPPLTPNAPVTPRK